LFPKLLKEEEEEEGKGIRRRQKRVSSKAQRH
jgi:hypothetical protein